MAFAVTNLGTSITTTIVTGTLVPAASVIVVAVCENDTSFASATVADGTNTYTAINNNANNNAAANGGVIAFRSENVGLASGATITLTKGGTGGVAWNACYITGAATVGALDTGAKASAGGSSASPSVTSGTPANAGDLFMAVVTSSSSTAYTFTQDTGNSWATPPNSQHNVASSASIDGGNKVGSGTSTQTYAPSFSATHFWAALIFAFKSPDVLFAQASL